MLQLPLHCEFRTHCVPSMNSENAVGSFFFLLQDQNDHLFFTVTTYTSFMDIIDSTKEALRKKGSQILLFSFQNTPMMSFYVWILFCLFRQPDRMTSTCLAFRTGHLFMSNKKQRKYYTLHIPPWGCSFTFDPQWHAKRLDFSWVYAVRLASGMWLLTWQPD